MRSYEMSFCMRQSGVQIELYLDYAFATTDCMSVLECYIFYSGLVRINSQGLEERYTSWGVQYFNFAFLMIL